MEAALKAAGKTAEFIFYAGAPHAFNADYRSSYRADAAKDAGRAAWHGLTNTQGLARTTLQGRRASRFTGRPALSVVHAAQSHSPSSRAPPRMSNARFLSARPPAPAGRDRRRWVARILVPAHGVVGPGGHADSRRSRRLRCALPLQRDDLRSRLRAAHRLRVAAPVAERELATCAWSSSA